MARESAADITELPARQLAHRGPERVTSQNSTFQQWQALLSNRRKRLRSGEFFVQSVRSITQAVEHGWTIRALLRDDRATPSPWAADLWSRVSAARFLVSPELMGQLGEKSEGTPELLAIAEMPPDDMARIEVTPSLLVTVFDRPSSPGNIGTLIRSADAFGGSALVVTGHGADPYDPKCVRSSTGSLFALPVLRTQSHREVLEWAGRHRTAGLPILVAGLDEHGGVDVREVDFGRPLLLVVGNETVGLTAAWRESCDLLVRIPMAGSATSLNAATAGSVALYEAMRSRRAT
ncbi:MAG TPA: TrmH family RNA methyltransferase [Streptosporangiaceae bacterium]|nr:TrmH family RNA methyltransferase [Streptosporangiaceae bacterium]